MSKPMTILAGEAVGAITVSVCAANITYFYAKNCHFSSGSWLDLNTPEVFSFIASIFGIWAGIIAGGIISLQSVNENSGSPKFAGAIGLAISICGFLILYFRMQLYPEVSLVFVLKALIMTLISGLTCGMLIFYALNYLDKLRLPIFGELLLFSIAVVLPVIQYGVPGWIVKVANNNVINQASSKKGLSLLQLAASITPPMLIIWGVLLLINETVYKTNKIN